MKIRLMETSDYNSVVALVSNMIKDDEKASKEIVSEFVESDLLTTHVLENQNIILGFVTTKKQPFEGANGVMEITFLSTGEYFRRNGYGKLLVKHVEDFANNQGIRKIYVKTSLTNKRAVLFWISKDYQFEARMSDFENKGIDSYFLSKSI